MNQINFNPSDERLREMIAEKDAEIASLRKTNDAAQNTVQRQWETIQLLQRDAERYRKLKRYADQSQNDTYWGWSVDFRYADDSIEFDAAIDALPEQEEKGEKR